MRWPDNVWICGKHWHLVPVLFKAVKRRARRHLDLNPADGRALWRYCRISARCTRAAIDRAVGIT